MDDVSSFDVSSQPVIPSMEVDRPSFDEVKDDSSFKSIDKKSLFDGTVDEELPGKSNNGNDGFTEPKTIEYLSDPDKVSEITDRYA